MPSFDSADPTEPLRTIFSDDQIEFLKENVDAYDIDELLDKSLKDLMSSENEPSISELMESATGNVPEDSDNDSF